MTRAIALDARAPALARAASLAGIHGAIAVAIGVVTSGPLALLLVESLAPQPTWQGPSSFAEHYHPLQLVPYCAGFVLIGGFVLLIVSLRELARPAQRTLATCGLVASAVFATLISLNYVVQTAFVPFLARNYAAESAPLIAAFSMSNPTSLAWGIEMWGYGFLGLATWLVAPVLRETPFERGTQLVFASNGVVGVAGALWTILEPGWVMTRSGMIAFSAWNLLALVLAVLAAIALSRRARALDRRARDVGEVSALPSACNRKGRLRGAVRPRQSAPLGISREST